MSWSGRQRASYSHVFWASMMAIALGFWVSSWFLDELANVFAADLILCIVCAGWLYKVYVAYYAHDPFEEDDDDELNDPPDAGAIESTADSSSTEGN